MQNPNNHDVIQVPWNKGIIMGQKPPLKRRQKIEDTHDRSKAKNVWGQSKNTANFSAISQFE